MITLGLRNEPSPSNNPESNLPSEAGHSAQFAPPTQDEIVGIAERLSIGLGARWEVQQPLAIGGTSTVFRIKHRLHGGCFVAKVLHASLAEYPELRMRFRTEAAHTALLAGHPNMAPILDIDEFDGLLYYLMPFIEGEDLDQLLLRVGKLEQAEALTLCAQIGSALLFAESAGVLHGDLTPGNLRLDTFGFYRLLDFGLSHRILDVGSSRTRGATLGYCSPEQLRGEATDIRSDLFSLGAILVECLTGEALFHASTITELREIRNISKTELPVNLGPELTSFLERLLAPEASHRFQNPVEMLEALAHFGYLAPDLRRHPAAPAETLLSPHVRKPRLHSAE